MRPPAGGAGGDRGREQVASSSLGAWELGAALGLQGCFAGGKGQRQSLWLGRKLGLSGSPPPGRCPEGHIHACQPRRHLWVPWLDLLPDITPQNSHSNPRVMCCADRETEARSGKMTCQGHRTGSRTHSPFWSLYPSPRNRYNTLGVGTPYALPLRGADGAPLQLTPGWTPAAP